jgi:CO/xanthine dehydrogenase Mo-binding subunit
MLTIFRQLTAEALGVPLRQVRVEQATAPFEADRGVGGSRVTRLVGIVISKLAQRIQERLAELIAAEFGYRPEEVTVEAGGFRTPDGRFHSLENAAALAAEDVVETLLYRPTRDDQVEVFAAQAAEVEVDQETGQVKVRRIVSAHQVGKIVNPLLHQGQIEGGLIQGLGFALTEGLLLEEGRPLNLNLHEYKLPSIADLPPLETILLPQDLSLGITPIGEGPNCGISACVVNAIVDVVGSQVEIPVSPDAVRRLAAEAAR